MINDSTNDGMIKYKILKIIYINYIFVSILNKLFVYLNYLKLSWLWSYVGLNLKNIKYNVPYDAVRNTTFIKLLYTDTKLVNKSRYRVV